MNDLVFGMTLILAAGSGLMAGVFYAFSVIVMRALKRVSPAVGIEVMQVINVVVINPWFMIIFLGSALGSAVLTVVALLGKGETEPILTIIGGLLYLVGTFLVTMIFNVPRNNALDAAIPDSIQGAQLWERYLSEWTVWNTVRSVAALLASIALTLALIVG